MRASVKNLNLNEEEERGRGTSEDEFVKFVDYRRNEEDERVWVESVNEFVKFVGEFVKIEFEIWGKVRTRGMKILGRERK